MKQRLFFYPMLFALWAVLFYTRPVQAADVVVGDGSPASCTEAAFDTAWGQLLGDLGGTLTFNCGGAHTFGITTAKPVDDVQITVDGGNAITLQAVTIQPGGQGTRLFQIFEGGFLTLQNIVLTGGRSPAGDGWGAQGGSIVLWDDAEDADPFEVASLTMRNSTIRNSYSSAWGGAIANEGGLVHLEQTGIYASSAPYGGAFNGTGYETFVNVTISGNTATQAGGGLRFWRSPRVSITGSTITDNLANTLDGGGIDNQGAQVTIDQSYIEHNTAARHGGGIQNQGTLTITNSSIALNTASQYHGGGINNNGLLTVRQSTFSGNSATEAGGAIFNGNGTLALANNRIEGNVAGKYGGGGIYVENGSYTIAGSTFSQNTTKDNGGGLFAINSSGIISQSLFYTNTAEDWGGGLGIWGGYATVWESDIRENRATNGGGIAVDDAADPGSQMKLTLRKTRVYGNKATAGGGLFSYAGNISLYDAWFMDNQAEWGGGVNSVYTLVGATYWPAIVYSSRTSFINNRATSGFGGAIYHSGNLTLVNSFFQENSAAQGGGALALDSSTNHPTAYTELAYNSFVNNRAAYGGALHNTGVQNTMLSSNRSLYGGNLPDTCAGSLLTSTGYNLTSDSSCGSAFTQATDTNNVSLPLGLQAYTVTWPTQSGAAFAGVSFVVPLNHPAINNPAINRIPVVDCTNTLWDLFNRTRPVGAGCDVGALEVGAQTPIKLAQSITVITPINATVNNAPFTLNIASSSGLPVTFTSNTPTICTVSGATVTPISAGTCTVIASQSGDSAYEAAAPVTLTFQISSQSQPGQATLYLPLVVR